MSRFRVPKINRQADECEHVHGLMSGYLDGELAAPDQNRVERHVSFCPRCRTVLANLRVTLGTLGSLRSQPAASEDEAADALLRAWRRRAD